MSAQIEKFARHMDASGCPMASGQKISPDDKWHRYQVEGDRKGTLNGSYRLRIEPDGFAFGCCLTFKDGITHNWHSKATRSATEAERAAWKARAVEAEAKRAEDQRKSHEGARARAERIWSASDSEGSTDYLERKGMPLAETGCRIGRDGLLVVPVRTADTLVGLQFIAPSGEKRFLRDTAKSGAFHVLDGDSSTIIVGEGLATCHTIRRALGHTTVVAFDAGNLAAVCAAVRTGKPDARIVIAADNDQWTINPKKRPSGEIPEDGSDPLWETWRGEGRLVNPGVSKAHSAAIACGGATVVAPPFGADDPTKRTDWWDYAQEHGDEAVRAAFASALRVYEPEPEPEQWVSDYEPMPEMGEYDGETPQIFKAVRPLGHNDGVFYFFPRAAGQIKAFSAPSLGSLQNLCSMADRTVWEYYFGGEKVQTRKMIEAASTTLIAQCLKMGIYDPTKVRGVGAWMDDGRAVFNTGDTLITDGWSGSPQDFESRYVYQAEPCATMLEVEPLSNREANALLDICRSLTWTNTQQGYVLAGWLVVATMGGALRWRPHIVVTGEKGAGKSTAIDMIVKRVLGDMAIEVDGGSTEAGTRRAMGISARPVIMDEAESESARDRINMEAILMLARKASSGGVKRDANGVHPMRSCFLFAAINPRITQGADLDRNTILELRKNRGSDSRERWDRLNRKIRDTLTPEFSQRLLLRTFRRLPTLLHNIEAFSRALGEKQGDQRYGDQYGTLIAGAYSLTSTSKVTVEQAREWCDKQDWTWTVVDNDQTDGERLLDTLLSSRVVYDVDGQRKESTIRSMIIRNHRQDGQVYNHVDGPLREYGIRMIGNDLFIANRCPALAKVLNDTPWGGGWRRALLGLRGASESNTVRFTSSVRGNAVKLPLDMIISEDDD